MTNFDTSSLPDYSSSDDGTSQSKEITKINPYFFTTFPRPDTPIESIEGDGTFDFESDETSNHESDMTLNHVSSPIYDRFTVDGSIMTPWTEEWSTPPQAKVQRVLFDVPVDEARHLKRKRLYNTTPLPRLNPATGYTAPVLFRAKDGSVTSDEDEDEIQPATKRQRNEIATPVTHSTSSRDFESSIYRDEQEDSAVDDMEDLDAMEELGDAVPLASSFDDSDTFVREWLLSIPTVYPSWDDEAIMGDLQQRDHTPGYESDLESLISNKAPRSPSYGPSSTTFTLNSPSYIPSTPDYIQRSPSPGVLIAEAIIGHYDFGDGTREYLVKWEG